MMTIPFSQDMAMAHDRDQCFDVGDKMTKHQKSIGRER